MGYGFVGTQFPRALTETGIIGIASFILLIAAIFKQGNMVFRGTRDIFHKGLSMGFLAGFIGLLVHTVGANTFIIVRIMEPFWFVLGMIVMIPALESGSLQDSTRGMVIVNNQRVQQRSNVSFL